MSGTTFPWGWEYVTLGIKERTLKVDRFYSLWAVGIIFIYFLTVGVAWILPPLRHFSVIYSCMARGLGCVCLWNQVDAVLAFALSYLCLFNVLCPYCRRYLLYDVTGELLICCANWLWRQWKSAFITKERSAMLMYYVSPSRYKATLQVFDTSISLFAGLLSLECCTKSIHVFLFVLFGVAVISIVNIRHVMMKISGIIWHSTMAAIWLWTPFWNSCHVELPPYWNCRHLRFDPIFLVYLSMNTIVAIVEIHDIFHSLRLTVNAFFQMTLFHFYYVTVVKISVYISRDSDNTG